MQYITASCSYVHTHTGILTQRHMYFFSSVRRKIEHLIMV